MQYCQKCVIPDSRPNIRFDAEGVCNACRAADVKRKIDWQEREKNFRKLTEHYKRSGRGYDCLIPVSGGKDSIWQVVKCLEYGLKPLAVTWKTPARTPLGEHNLQQLVNLGVDHIDFQVSPEVEKKFLLEAFTRYGATGIPMHMAIFNIPLNFAVRMGISLMVWGENSAFEYGGTEEEWLGSRLDANWLKKYGVTHGTTAKDWVSEKLTEKELTPYFGPSAQDLEKNPVNAVFLGYYFEWDPVMSMTVAKAHGFKASDAPKTGYYDFADIDDDFISIHHYLKWYKFGMTRTFDNLSIEIRNGRLARENAVEILRERGDDTPHEDIEKFCAFTGITQKRFFEIAETFRNQNIWKKESGKWIIPGFLISDWSWDGVQEKRTAAKV